MNEGCGGTTEVEPATAKLTDVETAPDSSANLDLPEDPLSRRAIRRDGTRPDRRRPARRRAGAVGPSLLSSRGPTPEPPRAFCAASWQDPGRRVAGARRVGTPSRGPGDREARKPRACRARNHRQITQVGCYNKNHEVHRVYVLHMAAKHGRVVHLVSPAYPTMDCSACGTRAKSRLPLSQRTYTCGSCGAVLQNSAAVMLNRAGLNPTGADRVRPRAA
jgi:putative transposase